MAKLLLKLTQFFVVAIVRYKGEIGIIYLALKKRSVEALTLGFLLCLLVPAVRAQEVSAGDEFAQTTSVTSGNRNKERDCVEKIEGNNKKTLCIANKIESLRLGWTGRFARGFQYDYKLTQQPETVFASFETAQGPISDFIKNPQNYLQQHTLTFKFAELFPDSLSLFKTGSDYLKKHPQASGKSEELSDIFCKGKPLITCLAKGGSWWQRALIGTSININFTERTLVQQGIIASPIVFGQKYQFNAGFNFDPAKLFITAGSWKNAFDEVQKIDKGLALLEASDVKAGRKPWRKPWAAALIPKVELKVLSRFDYVKIRERLQQAPFPERALNNWTFTWDLTRAIPDTKSRIDADAVVEALRDLENNLGLVEEPKWKKQCHLYFGEEEEASRKIKDVHPSLFTANSCYKLAKNLKAKDYRLFCTLKVKEGEKAEPVGSKKSSTEAPGSPQPNECGW